MISDVATKGYQIERLGKDRIRDLERLYKAVYKTAPPENYYQNKYNTAYTGVEHIGYLAYNLQGLPIAYYGVMPCFIQYKGEIILSAQSGDTMTHPEFRNRGLFVELAEVTFELCRENGIPFIFGFPNQNSYHGFVQKLGWQVTETMECFSLSVMTLPIAAATQKFKWIKPLYKQYSRFVVKRYRTTETGLPNSILNEGFGGVYRDKNYLQYKTYGNTFVLQISKAKVWVKINNALMIGDLDLAGEDFEKTMAVIRQIALKLGIKQIYFQACVNTQLHTLFKQRFKSIPSYPVIFKDLGTDISFEQIKFTFADIDIF